MQFIGKKMGVIFQKEAKINIEEGDMFQPEQAMETDIFIYIPYHD